MLERLQVYTRSIDDLDPLLEGAEIFLLGSYGFDSTSPNAYTTLLCDAFAIPCFM